MIIIFFPKSPQMEIQILFTHISRAERLGKKSARNKKDNKRK
jgi:hypothetical protein